MENFNQKFESYLNYLIECNKKKISPITKYYESNKYLKKTTDPRYLKKNTNPRKIVFISKDEIKIEENFLYVVRKEGAIKTITTNELKKRFSDIIEKAENENLYFIDYINKAVSEKNSLKTAFQDEKTLLIYICFMVEYVYAFILEFDYFLKNEYNRN